MQSAHLTQHAAKRLRQRGIPETILPLLFDFGEEEYDHHGTRTLYFNKKARERIAKVLPHDQFKRLASAMDAYVVLSQNDEIVTVGHRTHRINRH